MNIEQVKNNNKEMPIIDDIDFDFKPITSGLGFHHQKTTDAKPVVMERKMATPNTQFQTIPEKKEANVYQSDLSIFYGNGNEEVKTSMPEKKIEEKIIRLAPRASRISAYVFDLLFITGLLGIVLTVMARTISMDIYEAWSNYPSEITPLVMTLFCGFYIMYFSIFEKAGQSTIGKFVFKLKVTSTENGSLSLAALIMRSVVSLLNFVSLGLFSYFDLQDKITGSKVVRVD